ncbi:CPBP family glutamic-type intramembrane protease [Nocardiopsis flavescens]
MQRTNKMPLRAAGLFIILVLIAITLVCGLFLLLDTPLPAWFVVVGRWLPALVALAVLRLVPLPGGPLRWMSLRPGGWRRLVGGGLAAVAALTAVYALSAAAAVLLGPAEPQPAAALLRFAVLLLPSVLLFSLSTLGEEAAWRGLLQQTLADLGFWRSSALISGVWVLFHVPLHGTMALQGALPWDMMAVTTAALFPLGLFLSAVTVRFGSVWPAVFAHALPLSALNLVSNAGDLGAGALWGLTAVTAALLTAAAYLFARVPAGGARRAGA